MPPIQPNPLIVVTGISGFIASYVALIALREGHRVRGTVRSSSLGKAEVLRDAFIKQGIDPKVVQESLEFLPVDNEDFFSEGIWHRVFKDAEGVEHISYPIDGLNRAIVNKGVKCTMILLQVVAQMPTIKRFVFTSSSAAAMMPYEYNEKEGIVEDWKDAVVDQMSNEEVSKRGGLFTAYMASKVLAENGCVGVRQYKEGEHTLAC